MGGGGGGDYGLFPYIRLIEMCCWMGPHFHDWIDYHRLAFSIDLLEWGRTFLDYWGKKILVRKDSILVKSKSD